MFFISCGLQNDYSASLVHAGGNTVEIIQIKTGADGNDISAYSHVDKPNTGMSGFL